MSSSRFTRDDLVAIAITKLQALSSARDHVLSAAVGGL